MKTRNREQGESEYQIGLWDTLWAPLDAAYFTAYDPIQLATFVYDADI